MRWRIIGLCAAGALAAGVACVLSLLVLEEIGQARRDREPWPLEWKLNNDIMFMAGALELCSIDEGGVLPWDPRGPGYALYPLARDFFFDFDRSPELNLRHVRPWVVDHTHERITNSRFDYINEPIPFPSKGTDPVIVLAEKMGVPPCTLRYVDSRGAARIVTIPEGWTRRSLVGLRRSDLEGLEVRTISRAPAPVWNSGDIHDK